MENGFSMRNSLFLTLFLIFNLLFGFTSNSYGWSQAGHILIAQIAYNKLSTDKQKKAADLAQRIFNFLSPQQKTQLNNKYPTATVFAKIAALPDQWNEFNLATIFLKFNALVPMNLLAFSNESTTTWHYIDTPFPTDKGCVLKGEKNVEWAISNLESSLATDTIDSSRAIEMVFLEHYIGDLHEPLHSVTNVTQSCDGDRGGNNFCLKENKNLKCTKNLHSLWDGAVGYLNPNQNIERLALELANLYPATQFVDELNMTDISLWKNANLNNMSFIYNTPEYTDPTPFYYQNGQAIAKKQLILAGYRLGIVLNKLL